MIAMSLNKTRSWGSVIRNALIELFYHTSPRSVEMLSVFDLILFGVFLLLPFSTFGSSPSYDDMARLAPESAWGIVTIAIGSIQLVGVVTLNTRIRKISTLLAALIYLFLTINFLRANPHSTAVITYGVRTLFQLWANGNIELRHIVDKGQHDTDRII